MPASERVFVTLLCLISPSLATPICQTTKKLTHSNDTFSYALCYAGNVTSMAESQKICSDYLYGGGSLVTFEDKEEFDFINRFIQLTGIIGIWFFGRGESLLSSLNIHKVNCI